jgi:hypothetical protein
MTEGWQRETSVSADTAYVQVPVGKLFTCYLYGVFFWGGDNFLSGKAGTADNNTMTRVLAIGTLLY